MNARAISYALYAATCYWVLVFAYHWESAKCYKAATQHEGIHECVQNDAIEVLTSGIVRYTYNDKTILLADSSGNVLLLVLPGFAIGVGFLLVLRKLPTSWARGFAFFPLFVGTCWIVIGIDGMMRGVGWLPWGAGMTVPPLYGAMLWFLDIFVNLVRFDDALEGAKRSSTQYETLYDYAKFSLKSIVSVFLVVCFTLVWNASMTLYNTYDELEIGKTKVVVFAGLTMWGCLGFLGWAGGVAGKRLWEVAKTTPLEKQSGQM